MYINNGIFSITRLRRGLYEIRIFRAPQGKRLHWFTGNRRNAFKKAEHLVTALAA